MPQLWGRGSTAWPGVIAPVNRRRRRGTRTGGLVTVVPPPVRPMSVVHEDYLVSFAFYRRVALLGVLTVVAFAVIALRAWSLQFLHRGALLQQSVAEQTRVVDLGAPRGAIVDDRGRPLAAVGAHIAVVADAAALGPAPYGAAWSPGRRGAAVLRRLAGLVGSTEPRLVRRIRTALVQSPFAPATLIGDVSTQLGFYLDERNVGFPGLHVIGLPTRFYPQGRLGGTFLGLLGEVSPAELQERRYAKARPGEVVGQTGVEAEYDRYLNGGFDHARVRVDARGEIVSPLRTERRTQPPDGIQLTVDTRVQRAAERAVRRGIQLAHQAGYHDARAGAAVVLDARNGAVKALVSYPTVNLVRATSSRSYVQRLVSGTVPGLPLIDRATQALYPPGSTFKPIVAEAALASRLITPSTELACTGSLQVGNIVFHNVEPAFDALLDLPQALEVSCDTWFYRLGEQFYARQLSGSPALQRWAGALGLGRPTGIDLPGESGGVVPTPEWLRRTFAGTPESLWYEGTSVNLSIGQGYLDVTPLQLAVAYAALANGGTVVRPHVGEAVLTSHGRHAFAFPPRRRLRLVEVGAIRQGLYAATHSAEGTSAAVFAHFRVPVAGKTGTAQVPGGSDDSWFASWAPAGRPRYVVVVLIEHGGFGADAAAPAARDIYKALFPVPGR